MPAHKIRTAALAAALACTLPLAGCGGDESRNADTPPQEIPSQVSPTEPDKSQQILTAYQEFLTAQDHLASVKPDERKQYIEKFATDKAVESTIKSQELIEKSLLVTTGNPNPRPQVVAKTETEATIIDCQDVTGMTSRDGKYGQLQTLTGGKLLITTMKRTSESDPRWKTSDIETGQGKCNEVDLLSPSAQENPALPPDEKSALQAYKSYWEVGTTLPNSPRDKREGLLEKYASENALHDLLEQAETNASSSIYIEGGPTLNPVITETNTNWLRIYDCIDDSTTKVVNRETGEVKHGLKSVPFQAGVAKGNDGTWRVFQKSRLKGVC